MSSLFSFSKSRIKSSELKSADKIPPTDKIIFLGRLTSMKVDSKSLSKEILRSFHFTYENLSFMHKSVLPWVLLVSS